MPSLAMGTAMKIPFIPAIPRSSFSSPSHKSSGRIEAPTNYEGGLLTLGRFSRTHASIVIQLRNGKRRNFPVPPVNLSSQINDNHRFACRALAQKATNRPRQHQLRPWSCSTCQLRLHPNALKPPSAPIAMTEARRAYSMAAIPSSSLRNVETFSQMIFTPPYSSQLAFLPKENGVQGGPSPGDCLQTAP